MATSEHAKNNKATELQPSHYELVERIAKHMKLRLPACVRFEDLIQSGMVGLLEALPKFDETKGVSFYTFASIRVRGAMIDELRRGDWAPRSVYRNARRISEVQAQIERETNCDAKEADIAERLGITIAELSKMQSDTKGVKIYEYEESEHALEVNADCTAFNSIKSPHVVADIDDIKTKLEEKIEQLPENAKLVVQLYYKEELTLKAIGEILGVTESRVSQIHTQAMKTLKSSVTSWQQP